MDKLKLFCASSLGQDLVDKMGFLRERQLIEARLEETTEAVNALRIYSDIPLGGLRDIRMQ